MLSIIRSYRDLHPTILNLIAAEFLIQLINSAFLTIQIIFMQKNGYSDYESAGFIAMRFLGVVLFALPLGIYIKGRTLKSLFYLSGIGVPFFALSIILNTVWHNNLLLYLSQFLWGVSFTFIQIPIIPYILRNAPVEHQTKGISLSYSTYSFAGIISGILIFALNTYDPVLFNEKNILLLIVLAGFISLWFVYKMKTPEKIDQEETTHKSLSEYDWRLIIKSLTPTLIIAVGAGLTIPFISIFFYNVHHIDTNQFGIISSVAAVLVAAGALLVPKIKEHVGYKIAIPTTQSFAVIALVLLATTQFYAHFHIAVYIAVFCFLIRQPLMNLAGPMTTELVMNYAGKKNQEMVSALTSAIWSGSWFISGILFKYMRQAEIEYVFVFLITAALYGFGVVWYYLLILDYHKREKEGLIESKHNL